MTLMICTSKKVPVNIKDSYEANTALALQNHSGVPTQIEGRFIPKYAIGKGCFV